MGAGRRLRAASRALLANTEPAPPPAPEPVEALPETPEQLERADLQADTAFTELAARVTPFTMTSPERLFALREAVRYLVRAEIPGDFVEAGVWRGGSSMMAALTLRELGARRRLWLYDTFEGMPPPGERDTRFDGEDAAAELARTPRAPGANNTWAYATFDDVQANLAGTGHPSEDVTFVAGDVEQTIPERAPEQVALLRLDTDWYSSTRHELHHLWPRLAPGGVLIVDDYGHWQGARQAVDEFFEDTPVLLSRIDYTGRMTVKAS